MGWYKICIADGHFPEISIIPYIGNLLFWGRWWYLGSPSGPKSYSGIMTSPRTIVLLIAKVWCSDFSSPNNLCCTKTYWYLTVKNWKMMYHVVWDLQNVVTTNFYWLVTRWLKWFGVLFMCLCFWVLFQL
jgi:hypothetical protein